MPPLCFVINDVKVICGIHQLHYLPWLRYFHKIYLSDVFVLLDDIQFTKNGWQNRNKIKSPQGWIYLTIPVRYHAEVLINQIEIATPELWQKKHLKSLSMFYGKAPYFSRYIPLFQEFYSHSWKKLHEAAFYLLRLLLDALEIKTPIVRSSELNVPGEATERLINICKELGADTYLTGEHALHVYLEPDKFREQQIDLLVQKWECPEYTQQFPRLGFIPDLSIADLLFNEGPNSLAVIKKGGDTVEPYPPLSSPAG